MPIRTKNKGDLTGTSKSEQKARAAKFSNTANARVAQAQAQSQNGFKGESLNDHGLPDGHVGRAIIQKTSKPLTGAKFRPEGNAAKDEYRKGTKGIKTKKMC